jgi:hypothetical protein
MKAVMAQLLRSADQSSRKCRIGEHELKLPPKQRREGSKPAPVTAVHVSNCGNFAFVGTATGRIDRYNMQSGIHRGQYCIDGSPGAISSKLAHTSSCASFTSL